MIKRVSFAVAAIACLICPPATNAAEDITRTILQQADIPGSNYSAVLALAEIRPNVLVARHTHPGVEISYVLQGACDFLIEGKGKMHVKAGESFRLEAGVKHAVQNGPEPLKLLAVYTLPKGAQLATPAPE